MDAAERRREYARQYRKRNRKLLAAKELVRRSKLPKPPPRQPKPIADRFWEKVDLAGPSDCWLWRAGLAHGYGSFGVAKGKIVRAHRFAWELTNGSIPKGKHVLHKCDVPTCVNPRHLYIGTDVENARDRKERGGIVNNFPIAVVKRKTGWNRKTREDDRRGGKRKLSPEQAEEIRSAAGGFSMSALARHYGVSHPTIAQVIKRQGAYKED